MFHLNIMADSDFIYATSVKIIIFYIYYYVRFCSNRYYFLFAVSPVVVQQK